MGCGDDSRRLRLVRLPACPVGRLDELASPAWLARLAAELPPGTTAWGLIVRSPLWPPVRLGDVLPEVAAELMDREARAWTAPAWLLVAAGVAIGVAVGLVLGRSW